MTAFIRFGAGLALLVLLLAGCAPTDTTPSAGAVDCEKLLPLALVETSIRAPADSMVYAPLLDTADGTEYSIGLIAFLRAGVASCGATSSGARAAVHVLADGADGFEAALAEQPTSARVEDLGDAAFITCTDDFGSRCDVESRVGGTWIAVEVDSSAADRAGALAIARGVVANLPSAGQLPFAPRVQQRACGDIATPGDIEEVTALAGGEPVAQTGATFMIPNQYLLAGSLERIGFSDCSWSAADVRIRVLADAADAVFPISDAIAPYTVAAASVDDLGDEATAGCGGADTAGNCEVIVRSGEYLVDVSITDETAQNIGVAGTIALARLVLARL